MRSWISKTFVTKTHCQYLINASEKLFTKCFWWGVSKLEEFDDVAVELCNATELWLRQTPPTTAVTSASMRLHCGNKNQWLSLVHTWICVCTYILTHTCISKMFRIREAFIRDHLTTDEGFLKLKRLAIKYHQYYVEYLWTGLSLLLLSHHVLGLKDDYMATILNLPNAIVTITSHYLPLFVLFRLPI